MFRLLTLILALAGSVSAAPPGSLSLRANILSGDTVLVTVRADTVIRVHSASIVFTFDSTQMTPAAEPLLFHALSGLPRAMEAWNVRGDTVYVGLACDQAADLDSGSVLAELHFRRTEEFVGDSVDVEWVPYPATSLDELEAPLAAPVSVAAETRPVGAVLGANYPNPFNPATTIPFLVGEAGIVCLTVHSMNGQLVRALVSGAMAAGRHEVTWDGRGSRGRPVASGVYLYRLQTADGMLVRKMTLVR